MSIFSTQNLQTFFLRKYWRFPRRGPPGPPPGPPSRRGPPSRPPSRLGPPCPPCPPSPRGASAGAACPCFCSSAISFILSTISENRFHPARNRSACRRLLLRSRRGRRCRTAWTPCRALLSLLAQFFLPLQILIQ